MSEILKEAFKELQNLNEDTFSFDKEGIFNLDRFLKADDLAPDVVNIIDVEADSEKDLKSTYAGKAILRCCVCEQLIYKDPKDVHIDEDLQRANVDEDCPHCGCIGGYEVVGQVAPYVDMEKTNITVDGNKVKVEETSDEKPVPPVEESLNESVDGKPSIANYFKDVDEGEGWVTLELAEERLERSEDEIADWLDKHPTVGYIYNIEDIQVICTPHAPSFDSIAAELGITEYEGKEDLNESISKKDRDIILDAVKGEFETGHGYIEDKDEFEEMLGRRLTAVKYEELKEFYSELQDLGPTGFYEEYKDKLEFDPDFVAEFGYEEEDEEDDEEDEEDLNESKDPIDSLDTGILGAKVGDKILDTKTGKVGEVKKESQVDNYDLIYVDFGSGLKKINPMDDAQTEGRYKFAGGDESLNEDFHKATVETGDSTLSMETDENGKITVTSEPRKVEESGEEMVAPVSDEIKAEIDAANEEPEEEAEEPIENLPEEPAEEDKEDMDFDIDEIDENSFNELGESYFQKVYDNVDHFQTTGGKIDGDKILIEGVITFHSGKQAKTNFLFEGFGASKKGRLKFLGENAQISKRKNAFSIQGRLEGRKLITESLTYNYRALDSKTGKGYNLYGTVKNK